MENITPNPAPAEVTPEAAVATPVVPETVGTEQKETVQTELDSNGNPIDYRAKFIESSKGAHALLEEKKKLEAALAAKEAADDTPLPPQPHSPDTSTLYPGFEELDPEAQANLIVYTDSIKRSIREEVSSDPAIAFAHSNYAENKWETAFNAASSEFPELAAAKDEFKAKYFHPKNVPDNIGDILKDMAKVYLFDKARDIGAEEAKIAAERVQLEDPTGGDKTPSVNRSLSDWQRMAQQNPAEFAKHKAEYEADLASGKLKE